MAKALLMSNEKKQVSEELAEIMKRKPLMAGHPYHSPRFAKMGRFITSFTRMKREKRGGVTR